MPTMLKGIKNDSQHVTMYDDSIHVLSLPTVNSKRVSKLQILFLTLGIDVYGTYTFSVIYKLFADTAQHFSR